jgi:hypothetical protein
MMIDANDDVEAGGGGRCYRSVLGLLPDSRRLARLWAFCHARIVNQGGSRR